jgi:GNAT superfamily N-acetyltransferase
MITLLACSRCIGIASAFTRNLRRLHRHLEVHKDFRRRGIAKQLIAIAMERAKEKGAYQMRSWSSLDKTEAIPMWKAIGFGLCPATTFPKGQKVRGYFVTKLIVR